MGTVAAGAAIASAVVGTAATAYSVYEGQQAADAREEARERQQAAAQERFEAEKRAKQAERRIQQRREARQRRAQIREAQRKRSVVQNVAAQSGTADSTGATAAGRIGTQAASNFGFLQDVSRLSGKANTFRRESEQFQNEASQRIGNLQNQAAASESRADLALGAADVFSSGANASSTIFDK